MQEHPHTRTVAMVGARGYTGAELIRLIDAHDGLELALATSRELAGQPVRNHVESAETSVVFESLSPAEIAERESDVVVLALPNGASAAYVEAIDCVHPEALIVDLSADHRFADDWVYGLPEHFREIIRTTNRIANPGCYATGMQLALRPMLDVLSQPPVVFGVSGYSGAGTTPSERNDPQHLQDNLIPYSLVEHVHEREVTRQLGRAVRFHPHVASFFRGISLTVSMEFSEKLTAEQVAERFSTYEDEPLVIVQPDVPQVKAASFQHTCAIGGFVVDDSGMRGVMVATLDNLLKGAATQALQNINLACGLDEFHGIVRAVGC